MLRFLFTTVFLSLISQSLQASSAEWRSRSIYQVVTDRFALTNGSTTADCDTSLGIYCGGTWKGIQNQLDYIQGMGFDAVWISPITKQFEQDTTEFESYHGYWQQDLYSVNEHFGTAQDLVDLADALHNRDMYLMIDVVVGQMAWPGARSTVDYSAFVPFNQESQFHSDDCLTADAGTNQSMVQECWLGDDVVSLPDLRNEDDDVASVLYSFVADTVKNYTADGIRVDSVINLYPDFLPGLNKAAGVYSIGEVLQGNTTAACPYQDLMDGFIDYPLYFPLIRLFEGTEGTIDDLTEELDAIRSSCKDTTLLGTFSENHDNPRLASYTDDMSLASNAMAFDILFDGIPIIYYGQEQHFSGVDSPMNREALWPSGYNQSAPLYKLAGTLNALRTQAIKTNDTYLDYLSETVYSDEHDIAFRKGKDGNQVITVLNNNGAMGSSYTLSVSGTGFAEGTKVTEVVSCTSVSAGSNGTLTVTVTDGMPAVYAAASLVDQTAICNPAKAKAEASASASSLAAATATKTTSTTAKASATTTYLPGGVTTSGPRTSGARSLVSSALALLIPCLIIVLALA